MKERGMNRLAERSSQNLLAALVLLVSISAAGGLAAQTEKVAGAQGGTNGADAEAKEDRGADERVQDMIAEWKRTDPTGRQFQKRKDIILVDGVETANLTTQDKRWGKGRSIAYTNAFTAAIKNYVNQIRRTTTIKLTRDYFEQDLDQSEFVYQQGESAKNLMSRVVNKAAALGERKLDKALAESGMSADEIERMTGPQKKDTFRDKLTRKVSSTSWGSAAGLVPIKTFEAIDDEGNSAIGVVVAASPRMKHLAGQIAARRAIRPDDDRKRKPIAKQIWAFSEGQLTNEFGPRIKWDEHGYPTIIAFGQWAWSSKGLNKRKKARRRAFAMRQAEADADSHLSLFINASTRFTDTSETGGESKETSLVYADNTVDEIETDKIVDKIVETASVNSRVDLTGRKVQRKWFSRHSVAKDHELVGVIVSWSPAQEDQIRKVEGKKSKHLPPAEKKVQKPRVSGGSSKSLDLMKAKDF